MKKILKSILVILIPIAVFVVLFLYKYMSSRTLYNDNTINGNTIGNLYGEGLFCETNGYVYFANPNDDNALYRMTQNEQDVVKISDDRVYYLNADDHYVYYCRDNNNDESQMSFLNVNTHSLCRVDLDGKNVKILDDAISQGCSLSGNTVLYYHYDEDTATTLYSIQIDGKDKTCIDTASISPVCVVKDKLYYSGVVSDHKLHKYDISTGTSAVISDDNIWMPTVEGDYVYYMDLDDHNKLARMSLSDGTKITLSTYGTSNYNVAGNYIYYQSMKGDPDGLYRIDLSSGEETLLFEGQYSNINVTSRYVYMVDFFSGVTYHCKIDGGVPSVFSPTIEVEK